MAAPMENVCTSLFEAYSSTSDTQSALREFIESLNGNQLLVSKGSSGIQDILGHVHTCLTTTKQRRTGLQLLKVFISQCSTEVFQQNAERWIRLLLQIIQGHNDPSVYRCSLHLLSEILGYSKDFSDVSRIIVTHVIPELVPILLAPPSSKVLHDSIACINKCIETYPGPVGPFKGKLVTLINKQLSNNTKSKVVYKCFALLCQCGPGGSKGIKHSDGWYRQCNEVLGSMERTLDDLYEGFEPNSSRQKEVKDCLPLSMISHDQDDRRRITALKSRWLTLCGCLEAMLGEEMEATAKIQVDRIIQLTCRGLAVNCKMVLSKPTNERMFLASYLTDIHRAVLGVLEQFIVTCRRFLLPYSVVITGLLSQELLWTKTKNVGHNMTFSVLRENVYKVMTIWLKVLDGCAGVSQESKTWIDEILHDSSPYTESLLLTSSVTPSSKVDDTGKMKKKKRGYQDISQGISSQRKVHLDANCKLVQAGLEVLYWLITTSGSELDRKSLQAVHTFTIKTLLSIQQTGDKGTPIPYSQTGCRRLLYRVLQACVINPHPHAPPPTQCAVRIFTHGQIDKSLEVSSLCIEAMRICEVLIHPRAPVLNGPIICEHVIRIAADPTPTDTLITEGNNTNGAGLKHTVNDKLDNTVQGNSSSADGSKVLSSKNSLKRPNSSVESSDRTKFVKKLSDDKDNVHQETVQSGEKMDVSTDDVLDLDEDVRKDEGDHQEDNKLSDDDDEEDDDDSDDDGDVTAETYVATKLANNAIEVNSDEKGDDVKDKPELGEENINPEEEVNEEKNEEVTAMMLTFVDAEPDDN